jgi:hypothetical protein
MRRTVSWTRSVASVGSILVVVGGLGVTRPTEAMLSHEACDAGADRFGVVPEKRGRFQALPDVTLSTKVEEKLNSIARTYEKRTGRTFVVTSGTRDAESQAEAVFDKLAQGEDIMKLYKDKAAAHELKQIYESLRAANKPKNVIIAVMGGAIRGQMKRGVFISAHLRAGAADVRNTTMSNADRRAFLEAAKGAGGITLLEESVPPHYHLQLE